ncbi:hypothetical protein [Vibrio alfacsensis]|uniref:hypothetical protein n=1 Tax=Vibrio alfacsensis TaxID=1074311 RepID=UPI0040689AA8
MKVNLTAGILGLALMLTGCANEPALGHHVAQVKSLQTYNPNATQENQDFIPDGNGERMEDAYNIYTGKKNETLQGTGQSQVLNGF